jgi:hypothetical protein
MFARISPRNFMGLKLLLELSPENTNLLKSLVDKAPLSLRSENIISYFYENKNNIINNIDKEEIQLILDFLIFANDFIVESELSRTDALKNLSESVIDIIEKIEASEKKKIKNVSKDRASINSRLEYFLSEGGRLSIISKLRSVYTEHQNIFLSSRILTDIRPVFDDDAEDVSAALIHHNLKITYQNNDEQKTFFVALDNYDVDALIANLEKAKKKRNLIKASLVAEELLIVEDNI